MIAVIDYGAGNLGSVVNALRSIGHAPVITQKPIEIVKAAAVILPGVGAAGDAMKHLNDLGISDAIKQIVKENKPLFAICIGLQVLFDETEEGGHHTCLGIFPGTVKRFPAGLKIPHMGWNQVNQKITHPMFTDIPDNTNFYFVHSYYAAPQNPAIIAGTTDYGITFCSAVARDNVFATQFHPEKSGRGGLRLYQNFLDMALKRKPQKAQ